MHVTLTDLETFCVPISRSCFYTTFDEVVGSGKSRDSNSAEEKDGEND